MATYKCDDEHFHWDVTFVDGHQYRNQVDLFVGGSPCQSFSIAGNRDGLDGASGLMWEYVRAVQEVRPRWIVWENVPGALSSGPGKGKGKQVGEDFGCLLRSLDELGYGLAWRVLDAQFFGVAQRRRRVFLVGRLGAEPPVEVLFEPDGLRWDFESGAEKREGLARAAGIDARADRRTESVMTLKTDHMGQNGRNHSVEVAPTLDVASAVPVVCQTNYGDDIAGTLTHRHDSSAGYQQGQNVVCMTDTQAHSSVDGETCGTLSVHSLKDPPVVCVEVNDG